MGFLESVYNIEPQLANQWELTFTDFAAYDMIFKVQEVNLPSYKFEVETKHTGQKVYKRLEEPGEISMTLRVDDGFKTYKFFYDWFTSVYDLTNRVFKKHFSDIAIEKTAKLTFYRMFPTALTVPLIGSIPFVDRIPKSSFLQNTGIPSAEFELKNCKIIGLDSIQLDYTGNPLLISLIMNPEEVSFKSLL